MNRRHFHFGAFAGIATIAKRLFGQNEPELTESRIESRIQALRIFFLGRPAWKYSGVFISAADEYGLDWRLLPSICFVETGGGKQVRQRNNWFGWRSGKARFESVHLAIDTVARALANSPRYADKSVTAKLHVYNPLPRYAPKVKHVMAVLTDVHRELECPAKPSL